MGIFFAKKKKTSRITEQDKAILQLKQTRDKLKQYQRRIEQNIGKDREIAKKLLKNNQKDRALLLLRKKKFQERILIKTDNQLENLEQMVHDLEFAQVETQVIDGLKLGNEALKKLHTILSIVEIEKIMDETKEGLEKQEEIDALLSGALSEEDEDNTQAELNELMKQDAHEVKPLETDDVLLPNVPEDKPGEEKVSKMKSKEAVALEV